MKDLDLNAAIRDIVSAEIEEALAPHLALLARMSAFIGESPARRGPGRPRNTAVAAPVARRGRRPKGAGRKAAAGAGDASKFKDGQKVRYRQGRGEFEASVIGIDTETNIVTVQRTTDGKKVKRPASKVYEA